MSTFQDQKHLQEKNTAQRDAWVGGLCAFLAFFLWGIFPVYWKQIQHVPAPEILAHRVVWCFVFLALLLQVSKRFTIDLWRALRNKSFLLSLFTSTLMIGSNWFLYIWAVNSNQILETSMGYFMNPLFYVLLGLVFFRERLRRWQWVSVALAFVGVMFLTLQYGRFPWIAITLATTFGFYGLLRKSSAMDSLSRLWLETSLLLPISGVYLYWLSQRDQFSLFGIDRRTDLFLLGAGIVTALPLIFFGPAAKRLSLSTLGFFQYLAPTCQFLLAVFYYHETFTRTHFVTFVFIWISLAIYSVEGVYVTLRRRKPDSYRQQKWQ